MIFLLMSIFSSAMIFVSFRLIERRGIGLLPAILVNYGAAAVLGAVMSGESFSLQPGSFPDWLPFAAFTGVLFVIGFWLIGSCTRENGITVATIASKMSVVIPVSFSIIAYCESVSWPRFAGIGLAFVSVGLAVYRKGEKRRNSSLPVLPAAVFLFLGTTDSLIKYAQAEFIHDSAAPFFSASVFFFAGITALAVWLFSGPGINLKKLPSALFYGTMLGMFNFGSIYFLIRALNSGVLDSSIVFTVNNAGIVGLSVSLAVVFFGERPGKINIAGIVLSLVSVVLLFYL